jgi:hypothetical protein
MASYIVRTLNIPFWCSPHLNTSSLSFSLTWAILDTKSYQDWRLTSDKDLRKDMFRGTDLNIEATVSCLCLSILYRCGYCCFNGLLPVQIYSQNLIFTPLLSWNVPNLRNRFFTFMRPVQNYESPCFLYTCTITFPCIYFLLRRSCQIPCSCSNLYHHLLNKHLFWVSIFIIPIPPCSLGWHNTSYFASRYFFLWSSCCQIWT